MKVEFEGRTWQVDTEDVDMEQGLAITAYTGTTLAAWEKSMADPDSSGWLKAMRCLYWLMRAQNGEDIPLETANFAVFRLYLACGEAAAAERAAAETAAEEDPTKPAGAPGEGEPSPLPAVSLPG